MIAEALRSAAALARRLAGSVLRRRRALRLAALGGLWVLGTGLVATGVGVPAAVVEGSLGPHRAEYAVSTHHYIEVDLGPLGSLVLDSPLPWPLGVEVRVMEIPAELSAGETGPTLALAVDLDAYIQFFTQPDLAVREAARDLASDALRRVVLVWSVLILLVAAGRLASRRGALRLEARVVLRRPGVAVLGALALVGACVLPVMDWSSRPPAGGRLSPVLAGTPLADARIVGRLADLVDTYGGMAVAAIDENREFYVAATANLAAAYESDPEALAPVSYAVVKSLDTGDSDVDAEPAQDQATEDGSRGQGDTIDGAAADGAVPDGAVPDGAAADGAVPDDAVPDASAIEGAATPAPSATPTATPEPAPAGEPEDYVTFLVVSDLHCNVGMATVVGEAVRRSGARAVLNAGDTVISGTSVEEFCVDALAQAVPGDVPIVVADGNHDTEETTSQEQRAGNVVLTGEPVVFEGVRVLGDAEPNITVVTEAHRLRSGETREQMALRLAERACESDQNGEPIDILMVHNPRAGVAPMASGCISLQISGHFHRQIGPTHQGLGVLYVSGTTAGATAGQTSIGPLRSPGVITVLRYDPVGRRPVDYRIISVGTDTSVELGRWLPFPDAPVVPVTAELGLSDPAY